MSSEIDILDLIRNNNIDGVKKYIDEGGDIDIVNVSSETLLYTAVFWNSMRIVKLLLKHKIDINKPDILGYTPLYLSITEININIKMVKLLIKNGADINKSDNDGWTPLYRTIIQDRIDMVEILLKAGADVNIPDNSGNYPIDRAVQKRNTKIIKLLLDNGAEVDLKKIKEIDIKFYKELLIKSRMGVMYDLLDIYK